MSTCRTLILALLTAVSAGAQQPTPPDLSAYAETIARWEPSIQALEELDRTEPNPEGAVLLVGSSSIRLWDTAAADLAPYPVIRRGYGGAKFSDFAHFAPRLITPHDFRAAVVFVANDITGGPDDKQPEEVAQWFAYIADLTRHHQPEAAIVCCDVRPAPSRFAVWPAIREMNAALKAECGKRPNVHYLDTAAAFLTPDESAARDELYGSDRLHLSPEGTRVWSGLIKAELDRVLRPAAGR